MVLSESHTAQKKAFSSYGLQQHDVIPKKFELKTSSSAKDIKKCHTFESTVKSQLNASRDSELFDKVESPKHDSTSEKIFKTAVERNIILHTESLSFLTPKHDQLRHLNVEKVIVADDSQLTIISSSIAENHSSVLTSACINRPHGWRHHRQN